VEPSVTDFEIGRDSERTLLSIPPPLWTPETII